VKTRSDAATGANTELAGGEVDAIDFFQKMAVRRGSLMTFPKKGISAMPCFPARGLPQSGSKGLSQLWSWKKTSAPLAACFSTSEAIMRLVLYFNFNSRLVCGY